MANPGNIAAESGVGVRGMPRNGGQRVSGAQVAGSLFQGLFAIGVVGLLVYGFLHRDENWFSPAHGLGYLFGIVGTAMMVILLSYPLRKRIRSWRGWGRLPGWLKFHMLLGILGPTFVLFHANFRLGATNANVAMFAMLIVVASGIVGRYIYGKTHNRLSGELRSLQDLQRETAAARSEFHLDFTKIPDLRLMLDELETRILDPGHGVVSSSWLCIAFAFSRGGYQRRMSRILKEAITYDGDTRGMHPREIKAQLALARQYVSAYLGRLQRAAEFRFYERMFALWHVLHVPLLFLLIAAAMIHVAAVHLY